MIKSRWATKTSSYTACGSVRAIMSCPARGSRRTTRRSSRVHPGTAAVVHRDPCRIVGDGAAGAQAGRVAVRPPEEVQPECDVVLDRIVLDQGQLRPAHRAIEPRVHRL